MALRMRSYPLELWMELWISSSTAQTFHGVVIGKVHETTFGVLFCLSHKCALCLSGAKLTFEESCRKLVCQNYGYKCHQQPEAIQSHEALSLQWPLWKTEIWPPTSLSVQLPHSWLLLITGCRREEGTVPGPAQRALPGRSTEFGMKEDDAKGVRVGKNSTWWRRPGPVPTSRAASEQRNRSWWLVSQIPGPPVLLWVSHHSRGQKESRWSVFEHGFLGI